jgi:hypothetical protein
MPSAAMAGAVIESGRAQRTGRRQTQRKTTQTLDRCAPIAAPSSRPAALRWGKARHPAGEMSSTRLRVLVTGPAGRPGRSVPLPLDVDRTRRSMCGGQHPAAPACGQHPAAPACGRHPAAPACGQHPAAPACGQHPAAPAGDCGTAAVHPAIILAATGRKDNATTEQPCPAEGVLRVLSANHPDVPAGRRPDGRGGGLAPAADAG